MNPNALLIRLTTFDTQVAKIFCQATDWTEEQRDEVIGQYLAVRSLVDNGPEHLEASLQVVHDFEAKQAAYERGELEAKRFSRLRLALHLGGIGNSIEQDLTERYRDDDVMTWPDLLPLAPFRLN